MLYIVNCIHIIRTSDKTPYDNDLYVGSAGVQVYTHYDVRQYILKIPFSINIIYTSLARPDCYLTSILLYYDAHTFAKIPIPI